MYGLSLCENFEDVQSYVRNTLLWFQANVRSSIEPTVGLSEPSAVSCDTNGNADPPLSFTSSGEVQVLNEADMVLQVAKEVMLFLLEARALDYISVTSFSLTCSNILKGTLRSLHFMNISIPQLPE